MFSKTITRHQLIIENEELRGYLVNNSERSLIDYKLEIYEQGELTTIIYIGSKTEKYEVVESQYTFDFSSIGSLEDKFHIVHTICIKKDSVPHKIIICTQKTIITDESGGGTESESESFVPT